MLAALGLVEWTPPPAPAESLADAQARRLAELTAAVNAAYAAAIPPIVLAEIEEGKREEGGKVAKQATTDAFRAELDRVTAAITGAGSVEAVNAVTLDLPEVEFEA
jgi:rRNA-processing protein FCF1